MSLYSFDSVIIIKSGLGSALAIRASNLPVVGEKASNVRKPHFQFPLPF